MPGTLNPGEEAQLRQTIEMFEVITQSQPNDYQSLEILKEAYSKLGMEAEVINTSKRIAQAYVELGQLSSAILEFETVLQRRPKDTDALAAMAQIENKANNLTRSTPPKEPEPVRKGHTAVFRKTAGKATIQAEIDDGRQAMFKLFVDGKLITSGDFDNCWPSPSLTEPSIKVTEPFIHLLAEKAMVPLEKSLRLLSDKTRMPYLPLEKYDLDVELLRSFPKEICQRWCIAPFDRMSKSVMVATANPFNLYAAQEIEQVARGRVLWYLASPQDLLKILTKVLR